ncbi:MAG: hypothetical protein J5702_02830 [Bacteroidales bacterium]|nr:hypothetical protein [Bacteroidales bacterium]
MNIRLHYCILLMILSLANIHTMAQSVISKEEDRIPQGSLRICIAGEIDRYPVPYASVYLKTANDTIIRYFTISDPDGIATLEKIDYGGYLMHIESIGYTSHTSPILIDSPSTALDTVFLAENARWLEEARISEIGSPMALHHDTLVFYATSFKSMQGAMLEDLINQMPGLSIQDGAVFFNGKQITSITIEGKTFFLDNTAIALKHLPAHIVNKVLILKQDDETNVHNSQNKDERIMDIELKEAYKKGVFGYFKTATGKSAAQQDSTELVDNRGILYLGSSMVSSLNEKNQCSLIADIWNAPLSSTNVFTTDRGEGLRRPMTIGISANTQLIRYTEISGMAKYTQETTDLKERTFSESVSGLEYAIEENNDEISDNRSLEIGGGIKWKPNEKVNFSFKPTILRNKTDHTIHKYEHFHTMDQDGIDPSRSSSDISRTGDSFRYSSTADLAVKGLGKTNRNLRMVFLVDTDTGEYTEQERLHVLSGHNEGLLYRGRNSHFLGEARFYYSEPLTSLFSISSSTIAAFRSGNHEENAYDLVGLQAALRKNNALSSATLQNESTLQETLYLESHFDLITLMTGITAQSFSTRNLDLNSKMSDSSEWMNNRSISPYLSIQIEGDATEAQFSYEAVPNKPKTASVAAKMNVSSPADITLGNIFLHPGISHKIDGEFEHVNPKKMITVYVSILAQIEPNGITEAIWLGPTGARYTSYVNAATPSYFYAASSGCGFPLLTSNKLMVSLTAGIHGAQKIAYQSDSWNYPTAMDDFDYASFIASFYGDKDGSLFYTGKSGFESVQSALFGYGASAGLTWKGETCNLSGLYSWGSETGRYDHSHLNRRVSSHQYSSTARWTLPRQHEVSAELYGRLTRGYGQAFDTSYITGNFGISKRIGRLMALIQINDILNTASNPKHNYSASGYSTLIQNRLGRHVFLSLQIDFGKKPSIN